MSKGLIGKKVGMTRVFIAGSVQVPVTVIEAGPNRVLQVKGKDKDGYEAVQLGFGEKRPSRVNKPEAGHAKKAGLETPSRVIKEFKIAPGFETPVGEEITLDMFTAGEKIAITGTSKGKGYAGVMKRHGFHGGRKTHGCLTPRSAGSIGSAADPSRVFPGRKMAGHAGAAQTTVKNLVVVDVRPDYGVILVRGAVPGPNGGLVFLKKN